MKIFKIAFIVFSLAYPFSAKSQTYIPLLNDSMTWDNWWHDYTTPACNDFAQRAFISGDTVINSVAYKIISGFNAVNITPLPCPIWAFDNSATYLLAFMREDTALQKVWGYDTIVGTETLLCDFTLQPGNIFDTGFLGPLVVEAVVLDSFPDGTVRKKITFSPQSTPGYIVGYMIEGIGGSSGLYYQPGMIGLGFEYTLGCVFKNNIQMLPDPVSNILYCPGVIGDMNEIRGRLFADLNTNMIYDSGDAPISFKQVTLVNFGPYFYSDSAGNYIAYVTDTGNFSVIPPALNNFTSVPASHDAYFSAFQQVDTLNDFAYQPLSIFNDVRITLRQWGAFRPGFTGRYILKYENAGTTIISPSITAVIDPIVQYFSASVVPTLVSGDSVSWTLPPINPFESRNILLDVTIDTSIAIGTPITFIAELMPVISDSTPVDNLDTLIVIVSNSFDPNDISVDRDSVETTELTNDFYLNYMIRFQNTGNDTAINIRIENPLNYTLVPASLELTGYSHTPQLNWNPLLQQIEIVFNNINLPDSNINEPASHGFVSYRIRPNTTLSAGTYITNRASIYFDFNSPIVTNIVFTHIVEPLSVFEVDGIGNKLVIYPNPSNRYVTLKSYSDNSIILNARVIGMDGKFIFHQENSDKLNEFNIDLSAIPSGVYVLQSEMTDGKIFSSRIVKM